MQLSAWIVVTTQIYRFAVLGVITRQIKLHVCIAKKLSGLG